MRSTAFAQQASGIGEASVVSHEERQSARFDRTEQRLELFFIQCERLLEQNPLARTEGLFRQTGMLIVPSGDQHSVDFGAGENLGVVRGGESRSGFACSDGRCKT